MHVQTNRSRWSFGHFLDVFLDDVEDLDGLTPCCLGVLGDDRVEQGAVVGEGPAGKVRPVEGCIPEALESFAGCAVVISHDRWFLDRIATHILAFEGDSQVVWFEGNYSEYEESRKKRLGDTTPKRIRYKKLQ